ncbi:MAG: cytochrome c biogenesis protein CcsA [Promethearchaeota archaeon]
MIYIDFGAFGMDLGMLLLLFGLTALLFDVFLVIYGGYIEKWEIYSEICLSASIVAIIVSFMYFSYSIIIADYSFTYVSDHINNNMDFFLRLSAIWSGQSGSYFFWAFLVAIIYLIFRVMFREYAHETIYWRAFVLSALQVAVLVALTLLSDPFKLNDNLVSDGIGLNPLLMTYWNLIHPPVIFIGYALCLIPMVIGITRISILKDGKVPDFEGKEKLDALFEFMVSLAWLVLSFGIIIGAYWAYVTLGWGGFWAWDPVETASLIPWLFITLYFHGKPFFGKSKYFADYIVSMSYISALFATYLTRSNIISSVHTFQPEATLENILKHFIPKNSFLMTIILRFIPDERMLLLFIVILITFFIPHLFGIRNKEITKIPLSFERKDLQGSRSSITALKVSFISGLLGSYVIIIGLIAPVIYDIIGYMITFSPEGFGSSIIIDQLFFNTVITIFGGIMLLAQFFCTFYPRLDVKKKLGLMISGLIAGITFSVGGMFYRNGFLDQFLGEKNPLLVLFSNFWTTSDKANLIIPLLFLGVVGLLAEFINVAFNEEKNLIRKTSQILLHLSFLVILFGALMSANMTVSSQILVQEGREYQIQGSSVTITIVDLDQRFPESGFNIVEYDTQFMLSSGARVIGFGISRLAYDKVNRMDHEVTIISDLFSNIYIVTTGVFENSLSGIFEGSLLQIKIIPYINILWAGCIFLLFAILPLTVGRFITLKKTFSLREIEQKEMKTEIVLSESVIND